MKSKGIAVPYVIWMAIFVVAPLLIIVFYAFTSQAGGFTLENFSTMAQYTGVFGRSFLLAIIATFICLLIGYPLSYWLAQESPAVRRVAMMLIMLPMWMNFLLRTYSWMFLLEKRGLINSFLGLFGIGPFQMINTQGAIVLGMVYNFLPFMILPILSVLEKIDPKVIEAAQDLGANSFTVFRRVTFPLSLPGVLSGVLNVFAGTGINILTINQNIPVNGCAVVTITAETSALRRSLEELLAAAGGSPGVLRCEILAG